MYLRVNSRINVVHRLRGKYGLKIGLTGACGGIILFRLISGEESVNFGEKDGKEQN